MFRDLLPPLNDHNLPYPDTIHPIVVHFVIAMVLFAVLCDGIGYFTKNPRLNEVGWWNLVFATVSIFIAIIFGQVEAGLATPYAAAAGDLNLHTLIGWSLSGILAVITGWRYIIRQQTPESLPAAYIGMNVILTGIIVFQTYLGDKLVWVYGLHTEAVVEAARGGLLQ
ncbi:MAG: putative membrane protein [Phormidesmis priestleyi Ana]|uniref:Putative membrane protein n=1 Tax=Phormidesmis priestleyi Ana TaxID=1666911 RepID=A0A0P7YWX1_9CYAN|nr:MAG: putative membrane protein [Phormidesmis priestleyi Ana]